MPPKRPVKVQPSPVSNPSDSENVFTVEEEILWCIKKLETSLSSESITVKSLKSTVLALKTLKNDKAPFIKKRQVMRMSCGDYRKAMMEDLKKAKAESKKVSLLPVSDAKNGCVKRLSKFKEKNSKNLEESIDSCQPTFCFNFPSPETEDVRHGFEELKIHDSSSSVISH